ncbi:MAG TPA: response regulator [Bacteroidia bacterium]|nr:response regulator [Bacteroidia bacterium]
MNRQRTALIIDDEQDICYLLGKMLSVRSIQTETSYTIRDGLNKLKELSPSILFLDIHLPDGSGMEYLHQIRTSFPKLFIVLMSAYDGAEEKNKALNKGADFFLPKPFQREIVDELINTSLLTS